jgi:hypothetical protein
MTTTANDPRRVVLTYHTQWGTPSGRRWYGVRVACETPEGLFPIYTPEHVSMPTTKAAAIAKARDVAKALGLQYEPGLFRDRANRPLEARS